MRPCIAGKIDSLIEHEPAIESGRNADDLAAGDPAFIRSGVVVQGGVFQSPLTKSEPPPMLAERAIPPELYRFFLTYRARKRARRCLRGHRFSL